MDAPNIGRARQRIFDDLAGLGVEPNHAIGRYARRSGFAVAAGLGVIRRAAGAGADDMQRAAHAMTEIPAA